MRIYVHIPLPGIYQGNGGQVVLMDLAQALERMGYGVALFGEGPLPGCEAWDWLSLPGLPFERVTLADVLADAGDYRVVSLRLDVLRAGLKRALGSKGAVDWARRHLRYWDHDNLLRAGAHFDLERLSARLLPGPLRVTNPHLAWAYAEAGFPEVVALEPWIPAMFHADDSVRVPGRVGYLPDNGPKDLLEQLGVTDGLVIGGTRAEVAAAMRTCDWFLWWNGPKHMCGWEGEGFGLTLYEAMASGCAVIAHRHAGNAHLEGRGPLLCDRLDDVRRWGLAWSARGARALRFRHLALIDQHYRWNAQREEVIRAWLQ